MRFIDRWPWLGAVRAFAEAALIGGLADWFAVTALFRRPLGLPIPHTAIVPTRKDEIGRALARFIRDHFLVREAIERRLARTDLAARLGAWLAKEENAARVTRDLGAALDWLLRASDGNELRNGLGTILRGAFDAVPVSSGLAALLEVLLSGAHAQTLIDKLVALARAQLESQRVLIRVRIHERSPWWLPKFVDQQIFDELVGGLEQILDAIASDPRHPARAEIADALKSLKDSLAHDPALAARSRALRRGDRTPGRSRCTRTIFGSGSIECVVTSYNRRLWPAGAGTRTQHTNSALPMSRSATLAMICSS